MTEVRARLAGRARAAAPRDCPERRVRDIGTAMKGAFRTPSDLNAPFMTAVMSSTRLSWQCGQRQGAGWAAAGVLWGRRAVVGAGVLWDHRAAVAARVLWDHRAVVAA